MVYLTGTNAAKYVGAQETNTQTKSTALLQETEPMFQVNIIIGALYSRQS